MAEEVKYAKLKEYLPGLPANTPDTPYEISIVGYKGKTLKGLLKVIQESKRYVDLSSTVLDGLEDLTEGFDFRGISEENYLVGAPKFSNYKGTTAEKLFYGCKNLKKVELSGLENITNADEMFRHCEKLESIDISELKNLERAFCLFSGCKELKDVKMSSFEKLVDACYMFERCPKLTSLDLSVFGNVKVARQMFRDSDNFDEATKKAIEEFMSRFNEVGKLKA